MMRLHRWLNISFLAFFALSFLPAHAEVLVAAHRGGPVYFPENTLAAFTNAISLKVEYIEFDVQASKDDSLMIIHDVTVDRTTNGTGAVNAMTYTNLRKLDAGSGQKIPTLSEVLKLAKGKVKVCMENKDATPAAIIAAIKKFAMESEAVVQDFTFARLQEEKQLAPAIPVLFLVSTYSNADVDKLKSVSGEIIGVGGGVTAAALTYARSKNIAVWQWTVNDRPTMETLINLGINGIMSNDPKLLRRVVDSMQVATMVVPRSGFMGRREVAAQMEFISDPTTSFFFRLDGRKSTVRTSAIIWKKAQ